MADYLSSNTEPLSEARNEGRLRALPLRLASLVRRRRVLFAVAGLLGVAAVAGILLWTSGILGGSEPVLDSATVGTSPQTGSASNNPVPASTALRVTAVPGATHCEQPASVESDAAELDIAEMEDAAIGGIVQILTDVGSGSGFVADSAGIVVTDSQVIEGSWLIKIRLTAGETIRGDLLGIDENLGIAFIEVTPRENLESLTLGDSDAVCVGDGAFVGGYVRDPSSGRDIPFINQGRISSSREKHLSTDMSLASGSAGGPLFDSRGNVIGVNSSGILIRGNKVSPASNFAIPINGVKQHISGGLDQSLLTLPKQREPSATEPP